MNDQFQWEEEPEPGTEKQRPFSQRDTSSFHPKRHWQRHVLVLVLVSLSGWLFVHTRITQTETQLRRDIQAILNLEQQAFQQGDGDLFFTAMSDDPAWRAAQLLPLNQAVYQAGQTVTAARLQENDVWATIAWTDTDTEQSWQRVAFFRRQDGQLLHVPTSADFWGAQQHQETTWGQLIFQEADAPFITAVSDFITTQIATDCPDGCASKLPLTVALRTDYQETAVPHTLYIPSPRLIALTPNGDPAPLFWAHLRQKITAQIQPAHIRIALPPQLPVGIHLVNYEQAATDFMAAHPDITIELVTLDDLPSDPAALRSFDGAAFAPTVDMVAAGAVHDLTDFVFSDPNFDQGDFYEQLWQGAWWQGRMWFMPQMGEMQVLYYDKNAYRQANLPEPSLRWTWEEMTHDLQRLDEALPFRDTIFPNYRFYDVSTDVLYAYAYNQRNEAALSPESIAAALDWYQQMVAQPHLMPDVTAFTDADRELYRFRWWASVWVDQLVYYEHRLQILGTMGVVPFPGSAQFDGVTPLHVYGSFITQQSQHPQAVWEWLNFLSYQQTAASYRLIPARPSVAEATRYWSKLPRPLGEALRVAFPFARPITLATQKAFTWDRLTAVTNHRLTPQQATQEPPPLTWFMSGK